MVVMAILCVIIFVLLTFVSGFDPQSTRVSRYELERRKRRGDGEARTVLERENLLFDVNMLHATVEAVFLTVLTILLITTFGWILGILLSLVIAWEYKLITHSRFYLRTSKRFYETYEPHILKIVSRYRIKRFHLIHTSHAYRHEDMVIHSKAELLHLLEKSKGIAISRKELITKSLEFESHKVADIMIARDKIKSVNGKELLGPLVLDDLHKTGHNRFPVIDTTLDHIVGVLDIQDFLVLDATKRSATVERVMSPKVAYIQQDESLFDALRLMLDSHTQLLIVIDDQHQTRGLLALSDIIKTLFGTLYVHARA